MASVIRRQGRPGWYVVYSARDGTGTPRRVWRATGLEDEAAARALAAELDAARRGAARVDRLTALVREAAEVELPEQRTPIDGVWALYEAQPLPRRMAERTRRSKRNHVAAWVRWMQARHPEVRYLQQVSERLAAEYCRSAFGEAAGTTHNNALSSLHDVFRVIRVPAGLGRNVWEAVPRVEVAAIRREALSVEQVRRLFAVAGSFAGRAPPGFWPAAVALAWHTGLRWGDVCTLRCAEVDVERGLLRRVPHKRAKTGQAVTPWLADEVLDLLRPHLAAGREFVWPLMAEAHQRQWGWPHVEWREMCRLAGIETRRAAREGERRAGTVLQYGFHSLRHGYVSELARAGVAREDVQAAVGHASPAMTEHYDQSRSAWARIKDKMPGLTATS